MPPWDMKRRQEVVEKVKLEARRAAKRLGAKGCVIIAFFPEGDNQLHMIDAGDSPMELPALYLKLISAQQALDDSGGKDISFQ